MSGKHKSEGSFPRQNVWPCFIRDGDTGQGVGEEAAGHTSGLRGWGSHAWSKSVAKQSLTESLSNKPKKHLNALAELCDSAALLSIFTVCQRKVAGCNNLIMQEVPAAGSPGVKHLPSARCLQYPVKKKVHFSAAFLLCRTYSMQPKHTITLMHIAWTRICTRGQSLGDVK